MVDICPFPGRPFFALGLLANPPALVVWQIRKLTAVFALPLPALPSFCTLAAFQPTSAPGVKPSQLTCCLTELCGRTPALPSDLSAWNTLSEGINDDLRDVARLALADTADDGAVLTRCLELGLLLAGGGRQRPGQAHLIDLSCTSSSANVPEALPNTPGEAIISSRSWQPRSVVAAGQCVLSADVDGTVRCVDSFRSFSAVMNALPGTAISVSCHPERPLFTRFTPEGHVEVLLASASAVLLDDRATISASK